MRWVRGVVRSPWAGPGAVVLGLAVYAGLLPSAWMNAETAPYRMDVADVRPAPVAIVLGAGAWGDRPSPFLAGRLDVALRLYREGKVRVILASGDNSRRDYDEPTVMWRYLVERGVPGDRVVRDYAGFDTWDSCVRARRIFGVDRAIVVSQVFHLPRAVTLCRAAGVRATGVGHDSMDVQATTTRYGYLREGLASFKAMVDVARKPEPRFLGPREPGVRRALQGP
ncbi:vancomycin permeability regulator SanA [Actinomadura cellulosilytica]|uniref:Vancomycin permeability regulator SanA n=1 Tax=Thermomonospora cellulosilytica TaxID=1411118 RepID=A0A7W3MVA2_9ACTN|nr:MULTISPECIES: ElyC/SanA/YdcF family protein [Thermomonospora]MBA9002559.1 vancomycin permeability regulator SanA [Thermomonospora cellulosilytica]